MVRFDQMTGVRKTRSVVRIIGAVTGFAVVFTVLASTMSDSIAQTKVPTQQPAAKSSGKGDTAKNRPARTPEQIEADRAAEAQKWLDEAEKGREKISKKPILGDPSDDQFFVTIPEVMYYDHRDVFVENRSRAPRAVQIEFPNASNLACDSKLPVCQTVQFKENKAICRIRPANPKASWTFPHSIKLSYGRIGATHASSNVYELPYPPGYSYDVVLHCRKEHPREVVNAVDFEMPIDSLVCAMRDGKVIEVITTLAGESEEHPDGNMICIEHKDGTVARYARLNHYGSLVTPGKVVKAGDPIGFSGQTGEAGRPCLHVQLDAPTKVNVLSTAPITFRTTEGKNTRPEIGKSMQRPMTDPELEGDALNSQVEDSKD